MPRMRLCGGCGAPIPLDHPRCPACIRREAQRRQAKQQQHFWQSRQWRALSRAVRLRDGACTICGTTDNLTAHHRIPVADRPDLALDPNNIVAVCRRCHGALDGGRGAKGGHPG